MFFGLAVAFDMVDDAGVRSDIAALGTRLLEFLIRNGWNVRMPDGSISTSFLARADQRLTLLQIGRRLSPAGRLRRPGRVCDRASVDDPSYGHKWPCTLPPSPLPLCALRYILPFGNRRSLPRRRGSNGVVENARQLSGQATLCSLHSSTHIVNSAPRSGRACTVAVTSRSAAERQTVTSTV